MSALSDLQGTLAATNTNVAALAAFAVLYWLHRNRERFGGGQGYAIDPVCGMQVQTANAPARSVRGDRTYYFCSDRCRERFEADYSEGPSPRLA